ncbi:uncharacterized protein LOC115218462, partial [Argonauta hians]
SSVVTADSNTYREGKTLNYLLSTMGFYTFFGSIFLLIFLVNESNAIKCYSCSSHFINDCGDAFNFKRVPSFECPGSCEKTRGLNQDSSPQVNRMCSKLTKDYCHQTKYNDMDVTACTCNTDYCNSAPSAHMPSITLCSSLAALTYFLLIRP